MTKVIDHNIETGEIVEREMTKAELDRQKADAAAHDAQVNAIEKKAAAKAALLNRLGITAEEAALLLG